MNSFEKNFQNWKEIFFKYFLNPKFLYMVQVGYGGQKWVRELDVPIVVDHIRW
jgi:hypothetical protein